MASQKVHFFCFLLVATFIITNAQQPAALKAQSPCYQKSTCHDCIQTPSCAWCSQPDFKDNNRCYDPTLSLQGACGADYIFNPDNIQQILENKPLSRPHAAGIGYGSSSSTSWSTSSSSASGSFGGHGQSEIVQIQPQHLKLQLRPHQTYQVEMSYTQAEDYPVDLYYLMDLSKSMEDDKDKLSELGNLLAESMMNITSNFRLGFGSFVDKVVMPYVSVVPKKLAQPCSNCEAPYGYRNHMALSTNTSQFSDMVRAASVSGNLDAPEGGFDAIMQAVVCNKEIGWRSQARRLLVFSTDAGFHYAGDGKLGGIVKPNDGSCHLDTRGMYTHSSLQDYPSISQINLKVKEKGINIIFAVTEEQVSVYEKLKTHIEGASSGKLSKDSSNIVELVKEQYEKISSTVEMKHEAASFININYFTRCQTGELQNTNKCGNIKVGDVIKFQINIEATACPNNTEQLNQKIRIYPVGVGVNESLIIDLELLCGCDCEIPGHPGYEENSVLCGENGIYKCGICECLPGFYGRNCECNNAQQSTEQQRCRPDNTSTVDCSGRGSCVCGKCECNTRSDLERIYGEFCQCDNFSCERHKGLLCSGNGECNCGKCECNPGWTGDNCACKNTTDTCFAPNGNNLICSGNGECVCGECLCFTTKDGGAYSGKYCDKCPTCPNQCLEYKDCVQCQMYENGKYNKSECATQCHKFVPEPVDVVKVESNEENLCTYYDEDDCRFAYVYYFDENEVRIRAQEKPECPPKVFLLGIVLGVIAAIVLMGLAILLLWKLLTTIHDRREFAKFEKERMMAKWDTGENPIYKQATSTFKNPTYAGKG